MSDNPFKGRIIRVEAKAPALGGMLESPVVRQIGERVFIVGKLLSSTDPRAEMTFWFPLEDIWMITEYPDIKQMLVVQKEYDRRETKPSSKRRKRT